MFTGIKIPKLPFKFGGGEKDQGGVTLVSNRSLNTEDDSGGVTLLSKKKLDTDCDFDGELPPLIYNIVGIERSGDEHFYLLLTFNFTRFYIVLLFLYLFKNFERLFRDYGLPWLQMNRLTFLSGFRMFRSRLLYDAISFIF